jgi:hypothetical protein
MHMSNTKLIRSVLLGAASLACFTMALPARASLPGDGGYGVWDTGVQTGFANIALGSSNSANSTCFLSGISGALYGPSWANVTLNGDSNWIINVQAAGDGAEIEAKATCLNLPWGNVEEYSQSSNGKKTMSSTANGTQCFLKSITSDYGEFYLGASATITIEGSNWVLTLSGLNEGTDASGATAVCFEVPDAYDYWWNHYTGTYTISNPGETPSWQDTQSDPVACGLRGISGQFQGGAGDGVDMNWPSWGGYWDMTATNGKYGWLTCLQ